MRSIAHLAVAAAAVLAVPATAAASFPGANGRFAVTEENCGNGITDTYIRFAAGAALTPACDYVDPPDNEIARNTSGPDWSPDGSRLLYFDQGGNGDPARFMTVDADGTGAKEAGRPPTSAEVEPSFAPDGKRFTFATEGKLYVAAGDGSAPVVLRDDAKSIDLPRWSPKGGTIAVRRYGSNKKAGIWLVSAKTGAFVRKLAKGFPTSFDWSPDGKRLVFATRYDQGEEGKPKGANLYVVAASGKRKARRVVRTRNVAATNPVWSPDGRSIAWIQLRFTAGDVGFRVYPTLLRKRLKGGATKKVAKLHQPTVEEGYFAAPDLAWQPVPKRR